MILLPKKGKHHQVYGWRYDPRELGAQVPVPQGTPGAIEAPRGGSMPQGPETVFLEYVWSSISSCGPLPRTRKLSIAMCFLSID